MNFERERERERDRDRQKNRESEGGGVRNTVCFCFCSDEAQDVQDGGEGCVENLISFSFKPVSASNAKYLR